MLLSVRYSINSHSALYYLIAHATTSNSDEFHFNTDEINGRRDFDNTVRTLVIPAGRQTIDETVSIPIIADRINEATEGLMLVVRANEARSNPADIANLNYIDEGVCLLRITDDDGMSP